MDIKSKAAAFDPEALVAYTAPRDDARREQTDIFAAVNGETVRIRRGETVKIKRKFLLALDNARRQDFAAMETIRQLER